MHAAQASHATIKKLSAWIMVCSASLLPFGGCDKITPESAQTKADRQVQEDLDRASTQAEKDRLATLTKAAGTAGLSPLESTRAHAALAQAEIVTAQGQINTLFAQRLEALRLLDQLEMLARSFQSGVRLNESFKQHDPKDAIAKLDELIAQAQGGTGKDVWFQQGAAPVPTLSAADRQIAQLQQAITQKQQQNQTLTQQRNETLRQAEKLLAQSEQQKGNESVQTYKKAADLRKSASDLGQQAEMIEAALRPQQEQLSLLRAQRQVAADAIASFQKQKQVMETAWTQTRQRGDAQATETRRLYDGASPTTASSDMDEPATIRPLADKLAAQLETMDKTRQEAETHLGSAIKESKQAGDAAKQLGGDLNKKISDERYSKAPQKLAWQEMVKLYNPINYTFDLAQAQRMLGDLKTNQGRLLKNRAQVIQLLAPALQKSSITPPASLGNPAELQGQMSAAFAEADTAYKAAEEAANNIISGASSTPAMKSQGRVLQILVVYDQSLLAQAQGNQSQADGLLGNARKLSDTAAGENIPLPVGMPVEIAQQIAMPLPPTPATVPVETPAPATAPAEAVPAVPATTESPATAPTGETAAPAPTGEAPAPATAPAEPVPAPDAAPAAPAPAAPDAAPAPAPGQ